MPTAVKYWAGPSRRSLARPDWRAVESKTWRELNMVDGTSHAGAFRANNSQSSKYSAPCRAGAGGKAIAMRTIPRPKTIGACFIAAALLLCFTAPAHAQQIVEFVSNTGQSTNTDGSYQLRHEDSAAQAFTTGSYRTGYDLESMVMVIDALPASATGWAVTVKLWSVADGKPGSELCTLDNPATLGTGEQTFTNPATDGCTTLKKNTQYFVVMRFEVEPGQVITDPPESAWTHSDDEDPGAAAGWTISDNYYYRASDNAAWVESSASLKIKFKGAYGNKDKAALLALYNATDGNRWRNERNGTDEWNDINPLENWHGVTVTAGRVTSLVLDQNFLDGSLPADLGDLTYLTQLNLSFNGLTGAIPADLGDLTYLTSLALNSNLLTGSIPEALGGLTNLTTLNLVSNGLTGSIPAELGDLTNLTDLILYTNQLTGSIPEALGGLTNLTTLNLVNNGLTGSIPAELGDLTNLTDLSLAINALTGAIPEALGGLTDLKYLILYTNQLTGAIPAELGGLTDLKALELNSNQLTGSIPAELGGLTNLTSLALNSNLLTGSIPAELGGLTNLTDLSLAKNALTGAIPTALGGLTNLEGLYLDNNSLTGSIPTAFRNLSNLLYLYVDKRLCVPAHTAFQQWFGDLDEFEGDSTNICPAPTASDGTVSTDEDTAYTFLVTDFGFSEDDGDTLDHVKITVLPGTNQGTLSLEGADITDVSTPKQVTKAELDADKFKYTPPADANGNAFATFDFKVNDGGLDSAASYIITVDVKAVNDAPVATTDTAVTSEGTAIIIGVLENDSDVDGDTLRVTVVDDPPKGTASINPNSTTVTYTPDDTFTSGDDTFNYTVTDGLVEVTTSVTVTIIPASQNANLSNLTISSGTLTGDFAATTMSYAVEVGVTTASLKVTPTTAEVDATVTVDGGMVMSGSASAAITLALGAATPIPVQVTAADGTTTQTYTITVHRAADRTRPTVAITSEAAAPLSEAFTVTIRFSEPVEGFELEDIEVSNGTASNFNKVSSRTYTATITPEETGEVRVEVRSNVARDRAGNRNRVAEPLVIEADLQTGDRTYYFPHLAVGAGWQTTITYINYSPQEVSCQTEFLSDQGSSLMVSFADVGTVTSRRDVLQPGGSVHQETNVELSAPLSPGWAKAACSGPVKASLLFRLYNSEGMPVAEAGVNATRVAATRFVTFAEQGEGKFGTGVAYANPSATAALVTFTAKGAAGQVLARVDRTLLPGDHDAHNMVHLFGLSSFSGSLYVTSTEPIFSLSLNFEADPSFSSLPPGEIDTAAQGPQQMTTYYFPHLAVGDNWQTTITYINYSSQEVTCHTDFLSDHGSSLLVLFADVGMVDSRIDVLPPGGAVHEETNVALSAPMAPGWARATCSGPVKASLLFRQYNGAGLPVAEAGVNATRVAATRFVTFAEQGEGKAGTGVAYANPSATAALVTFTAKDAGGKKLISVERTLLAGGHDAQSMASLFGLSSFTGSLEITSTEPIVTLSLNFEADPSFSSLPPGEIDTAAQ